MSQGAINSSGRRLGSVRSLWSTLGAQLAAGRPASLTEVEHQVGAIDARSASLSASRDGLLAYIRKLEGTKAKAIDHLGVDSDKLASAMSQASTARGDLVALRKAVVADQNQVSQIATRLADLKSEAGQLSGRSQALGAAQRRDFQAAFGAKDYLTYLATLKPSEVPTGARDAAQGEAGSSRAGAAAASLSQDNQRIARNNSSMAAIAGALAGALAGRKHAEGRLAADRSGARQAQRALSGAQHLVGQLDFAAASANDTLFHVDGLLRSDDAKVRALQGQIDQLGARRKALLNSAISADDATISSLDRQISSLEASKARTQQEVRTLEGLRGQ